MFCNQPITYSVVAGDNLFLLSRRFNTTVQMILLLNPGVNPYNLQIGSTLIICPGQDYMPEMPVPPVEPPVQPVPPAPMPPIEPLPPVQPIPPAPMPPIEPLPPVQPVPPVYPVPPHGNKDCAALRRLVSEMRLAWSQHIYWTRMAIISIAEKLSDEPYVVGRLMQNPYALSKILLEFYPQEDTIAIEALLAEHLDLGGRLVTALRDGKMKEADSINERWYQNAEKLAGAFAALNPNYNAEALRRMLFKHLEDLTRMAAYRLGGSYLDDINMFDEAERHMLGIADYFSDGIIKQFPSKF